MLRLLGKRRKGFTLIELMIVIAIIAILATILIVQWVGARKAAFDSEALTVARNCVLAAQVFYAQNDLSYENLEVGDIDEGHDLAVIEPSIGTFLSAHEDNECRVVAATQDRFNIYVKAGRGTKEYFVSEQGVDDTGYLGGAIGGG